MIHMGINAKQELNISLNGLVHGIVMLLFSVLLAYCPLNKS